MIAPGIRVVRGPDWIWQNQGKIHTEMLLISQRSVIYMYKRGYFLEVHFLLCCYQYIAYFIFFIFFSRVLMKVLNWQLKWYCFFFFGLWWNWINWKLYWVFWPFSSENATTSIIYIKIKLVFPQTFHPTYILACAERTFIVMRIKSVNNQISSLHFLGLL